MILNGWNPVIAGFFGALLILTISIYLSHGFNSKTTIALVSTFLGMGIVCVLALFFIELAGLTGFGDEHAFYFISNVDSSINMKGILYVSIIIGGVGIIDDVTVNQVSAMKQIYIANPKLSRFELFSSAMVIGKDHISSMVNTLFIAYAGASLPIIMLLQANSSSFTEIVNSDMFAEEISRAIIGSIGLILVVPITSFIASHIITKPKIL